MRGMGFMAVMVLVATVVLVGAPAALAAPAAEAGLTAEQLALKGATVKFQVDVNGDAAMQLIGGVLDAAAEVAQQQAAAGGEGGPAAEMAIAEPFIGPAKDLLKSVSRVTVLVMGTPEGQKNAITYYGDMMGARGWSPLVTTRAITGQDAAVYLAPGGKGVFVVARPNGQELVVALVTTHRPIGDLLAQIVRSGGGKALPMLLAGHQRPAPKQDCKQALTEASEPPLEADASGEPLTDGE